MACWGYRIKFDCACGVVEEEKKRNDCNAEVNGGAATPEEEGRVYSLRVTRVGEDCKAVSGLLRSRESGTRGGTLNPLPNMYFLPRVRER